jgi:Complex I intermediate-associated protein 30 (CIA30)
LLVYPDFSLFSRLQIPFSNFVRTSAGELSINQMEMLREKIKSVGISILGGNSGVEGKYELGIDSIRVVNEEDVAHTPISRLFASPHAPLVLNLIISLLQKLKITRRHETCKSELTFNSSSLFGIFFRNLNSIYNVNATSVLSVKYTKLRTRMQRGKFPIKQ